MSEERRFLDFARFHTENPYVYDLFKRFAFEAIKAGRTRLAARLIGERIRWECSVVVSSADEFKLNNNHLPYYARLFAEDHPEYSSFFEFREHRNCARTHSRPGADF